VGMGHGVTQNIHQHHKQAHNNTQIDLTDAVGYIFQLICHDVAHNEILGEKHPDKHVKHHAHLTIRCENI